MKRHLHTISGLLAGTLLAATAGADSGTLRPRGAPAPPPLTPEEKAAQRAQHSEDLGAWLGRLMGRYSVEGVVKVAVSLTPGDPTVPPDQPGGDPGQMPVSATGKVDCIAVGKGPGVHCVIYVTWPEFFGPAGRTITGGTPFLGPASILYGVDPNGQAIRYMQLDTDGLVTDGAANLYGDMLEWERIGYCPREPQRVCKEETRIYMPLHGKWVHISIKVGPERLSAGKIPDPADSVSLELEMTPVARDPS